MKHMIGMALLLSALSTTSAFGQTEIYKNVVFVYDDSWQSKAEWDDCRICIPKVTVRWRSLRHEMTLVVKGPDSEFAKNAVNSCMQEAIGAGLVATLAAVYTGGAAMPAAWGAFEQYFVGCLSYKGAGSVSFGIEDRSQWTPWS
jgi:hypothetical protein